MGPTDFVIQCGNEIAIVGTLYSTASRRKNVAFKKINLQTNMLPLLGTQMSSSYTLRLSRRKMRSQKMLLQAGKGQGDGKPQLKLVATLLSRCVRSHTPLGPRGHYQGFQEHCLPASAGLQEKDHSYPLSDRARELTVLIGIRTGDLLNTHLLRVNSESTELKLEMKHGRT